MQRGGLRGWRAIGLLAGMTGMAWSLAVAAAPTKAAKGAPPAVQEIELVEHLDGDREAALRNLVERFNEANKNYRVVLSERDWRSGPMPQLLMLDAADGEEFTAGKPRYKPLHALMREAGQSLPAVAPSAVMTRTVMDAKGRLLALPVGLSTPVLYLNKEAFRRAGLNPDTPINTWFELQQALGRLFDAGQACPYTVSEPAKVMVENLSAWHNEPAYVRRGKVEAPSFNGMLQIKHVALMASWYRARYLHIFDQRQEAERRFAAGECAVIAASSASGSGFRRHAAFDVGVLRLPYDEDFPGAPQNTLADGAALWAAAGKRPAEYKAAARFVAFWLEPDNQLAWQRDAGYLPLNKGGMLALEGSAGASEADAVRVGIAELAHKPPTSVVSTSASVWRARVRRILDEELAGVWADRKPAKQALDDAVMRAMAR